MKRQRLKSGRQRAWFQIPKMKLSITPQAPLLDPDSFGSKLTVDFI